MANVQRLRNLGVANVFLNLHGNVGLKRAMRTFENLTDRIEKHTQNMKKSHTLMNTALRRMQRTRIPGNPHVSKYAPIGVGGNYPNPIVVRRMINRVQFPKNQDIEMFVRHYNAKHKTFENIQRLERERSNAARQFLRHMGQRIPQHNFAALIPMTKNLIQEIKLTSGRTIRNALARHYHTKVIKKSLARKFAGNSLFKPNN